MSEQTITADEAVKELQNLSAEHYREDLIWVDAKTEGERNRVNNAASVALKNGYVQSYGSSNDAYDLRVFIRFRKPITLS